MKAIMQKLSCLTGFHRPVCQCVYDHWDITLYAWICQVPGCTWQHAAGQSPQTQPPRHALTAWLFGKRGG